MNLQDITRLVTYINGLDPMFVADTARAAAWHSHLPEHITYQDAKHAVDLHYKSTRNTIRPKDITDFSPPASNQLETYTKGTKPLCGNCENGYVLTPQPPNAQGYVFNRVNLCDCQWDGPPRVTENLDFLFARP